MLKFIFWDSLESLQIMDHFKTRECIQYAEVLTNKYAKWYSLFIGNVYRKI